MHYKGYTIKVRQERIGEYTVTWTDGRISSSNPGHRSPQEAEAWAKQRIDRDTALPMQGRKYTETEAETGEYWA